MKINETLSDQALYLSSLMKGFDRIAAEEFRWTYILETAALPQKTELSDSDAEFYYTVLVACHQKAIGVKWVDLGFSKFD